MTNKNRCGYCGNEHTRQFDVVCPIGFNKTKLPLVQEGKGDSVFSLEVVIPRLVEEKVPRSDEANELVKLMRSYHGNYPKVRK